MVVLVFVLMLGIGTVEAIEEPNDIVGMSYLTTGETETSGPCPSWDLVFSRKSKDGPDGMYLYVEVDACQIIVYDVNSVEQGTPEPVTIEMEKDDYLIVWDEDSGHGSNEYFSFTGSLTTITDPNAEPIQISSNNETINWVIHKASSDGTLTITDTGQNEHDVVHLQRNWLELSKEVVSVNDSNDFSCIEPGDTVTYEICWDNNSIFTFEDCYLVDYLPEEVFYPGSKWTLDPNWVPVPPDPAYDPNTHTYIYLDLGTIYPDDANCVELTVEVNGQAEPEMYLHNAADLYATDPYDNDSNLLIARATVDTLVCCWDDIDPNIIYVDIAATGDENGTDWTNAYTDLADAIRRASNSNCITNPQIYVAQGTYDPENTPDKSFVLPDNCSVYGGFRSGDTFSQRKPKKYVTILTGDFDDDDFPDADTVVTMGDESLLDGFTVTKAAYPGSGVYGNGVDFTVENCTIKESEQYGIYAQNGDVTVKWCKVLLNDSDGIYHEGEGYTLTVENCWNLRNGEAGIATELSTPTIKNSIISESDFNDDGYPRAGIRLYRPKYSPVLYNNTVSNNKAEGIYFEDNRTVNNPTGKDWPDIQNCIVYYNNGDGRQFSKDLDQVMDTVVKYSCIQDCNEVNSNRSDEPGFAYTVDPNGTPNPENYHLAYDSNCIDEGSLLLIYTNQVDIDGEGTNRKSGDAVDIGADEVYSCGGSYTEDEFYNAVDWNADGIVNLHEFSIFSGAWLSHDPNGPGGDPNGWNPICNLDASGTSQYVIDLDDLIAFVEDDPQVWLWEACWRDDGLYGSMAMGGGESMMAMPMETMSFENTFESVEATDPYTEMSSDEVVSLVVGIHQVIDHIEISIEENHENAENLIEAKDFLEDVMADIRASRETAP